MADRDEDAKLLMRFANLRFDENRRRLRQHRVGPDHDMPRPALPGGPRQALPWVAAGSAALALAFSTLALSTLALATLAAGPAAAQQSYRNDGPLVLRPPPGVMPSSAALPGQTVTAGGSVTVNLNAIGGAGAAAGATGAGMPGYPSLQAGAVPHGYFARPPLPGEVPLVDEDPILLRPPGPDGYGQANAGNRLVLRPPQAASQPRPTIETRPLPDRSVTTTARRSPAPAPQPKPAAVAAAPARAAAPSQQAAAKPAAGPALRSQVRGQDDDLAASTGSATAPAGKPMADKPMADKPATEPPKAATPVPAKPSTVMAATTPTPPAKTPATTGATAGSGTPVTLPATSAPSRSDPATASPAVPAPPSSAAKTAPQQTAAASAPERTLPAVPQGDAGIATIDFKEGDATLSKAAEQQLATLAAGMKDSAERLQIKAFAQSPENGSSSGARRLSLSRALSVRSYLIDQGIRSTRIDVRALGDTGSGSLDRVDISLNGRS